MQADVILKEPPSWVPPSSLSGGGGVEGGPAPSSYAPGYAIFFSDKNINQTIFQNDFRIVL